MKKIGMLLVLVALAACASETVKNDKPKDEASAKPVQQDFKTSDLLCPQVAILKEAEEVFDYGGETPDPAQLVAKARLKRVEGDCAYRQNGIDITFALQAIAARGPRVGSHVSFPYFIAVVDPAENILSRQTITAPFDFSGVDTVVETNSPLHVFIPLPETGQQAGPDYRVLVGFERQK